MALLSYVLGQNYSSWKCQIFGKNRVLGPLLDKISLCSSFLLWIYLPFDGFMSWSQDETWGELGCSSKHF